MRFSKVVIYYRNNRGIAQLVARLLWEQEVASSNLAAPTIFFCRLKTEMFFGETFTSVEDFQQKLEEYICYFNNERVSLKLGGMSPVQYRTHSK